MKNELYNIDEIIEILVDKNPRLEFRCGDFTINIGPINSPPVFGECSVCVMNRLTRDKCSVLDTTVRHIILSNEKIFEMMNFEYNLFVSKMYDPREEIEKIRATTIKPSKKISLNELVKRQTDTSQYSHYEGKWGHLVKMVEDNFDNGHQGYRDGVWIVPLSPYGFYSPMCKIDENSILETKYVARREGEDKYLVTTILNGKKTEAKFVNIVLYRHDVLEENKEASTDAEWEIISIGAMLTEDEPMAPITMARNFLHEKGGTKAEFTAEQFANSIWFWKDYAMYESKPTVKTGISKEMCVGAMEGISKAIELKGLNVPRDIEEKYLGYDMKFKGAFVGNPKLDLEGMAILHTLENILMKCVENGTLTADIDKLLETIKSDPKEYIDHFRKTTFPEPPYFKHYKYDRKLVSPEDDSEVKFPPICATERFSVSSQDNMSKEPSEERVLDMLIPYALKDDDKRIMDELRDINFTDVNEIVSNIESKIPDGVRFILDEFHHNTQFEAYIVGGCVRDCILQRVPKDWDICTNATPEEVMTLFNKYTIIPTGIKHGTVTLVINDDNYEITTFRTDGDYSDGRHPDNVTFASTLEEDLSRRDFTMNAIAYSPYKGLADPFDGLYAIRRKAIICVGDGFDRFQEDGLRILRAYRFAATLNFNLNANITSELKANRGRLLGISKERVRDELNKIIVSNNLKPLRQMYSDNILTYIIPIFNNENDFNQENPYHNLSLFEHTFTAMERSISTLEYRLALLLHDIGKLKTKTYDESRVAHYYDHPKVSVEMARDILNDLKYDNKTKHDVLKLIEYHDANMPTKKSIKRILNKLGEDLTRQLLMVKYADILAQSPLYFIERAVELSKITKLLNEIIKDGEAFSVKLLAISGKDIIEAGYSEGKIIGEIKDMLLERVMDGKLKNTREDLLDYVKNKYNK